VESQPTIPASAAVDLPDGVVADDVIFEETLGPGAASTHRLPRGGRLRLVDTAGDGCVALMLHRADAPTERLNVADTIKVQWQAYLGPGAALLSGMGRVLATFVDDTSARHDALCGASIASDNAARYGDGMVSGPTPSARDRLLLGLAKWGLSRRDLPPALTLFKGVRVGEDGALDFDGDVRPGRHITLRAEVDLIVTLANCPHRLDPRPAYSCSPVRMTAWSAPPTPPDDPLRASSPEVLRAFQNTEALLAEEGLQ
jgi:urea carboxylase-associated protein 2